MEAGGLPDLTAAFAQEHPEIPFSYLLVLYQTVSGGLPDADTATTYHEDIGYPDMHIVMNVKGTH